MDRKTTKNVKMLSDWDLPISDHPASKLAIDFAESEGGLSREDVAHIMNFTVKQVLLAEETGMRKLRYISKDFSDMRELFEYLSEIRSQSDYDLYSECD